MGVAMQYVPLVHVVSLLCTRIYKPMIMNHRLRIATEDHSMTLLVIDKVRRDLHYLEIDYKSRDVHSNQGQSNLY